MEDGKNSRWVLPPFVFGAIFLCAVVVGMPPPLTSLSAVIVCTDNDNEIETSRAQSKLIAFLSIYAVTNPTEVLLRSRVPNCIAPHLIVSLLYQFQLFSVCVYRAHTVRRTNLAKTCNQVESS